MKTFGLILSTFLGLAFAAGANAADTKKLLVGKWEATKADEGTLPPGTVVEFTEDGKIKINLGKDNGGLVIEATYTVDGDSFTMKRNADGKEQTYKITIKKISETEMDTTNPEGKAVAFKKVK